MGKGSLERKGGGRLMRITHLINYLNKILRNHGNLEIKIFCHEGDNGLRGWPMSIAGEDGFFVEDGVLKFGYSKATGWKGEGQ